MNDCNSGLPGIRVPGIIPSDQPGATPDHPVKTATAVLATIPSSLRLPRKAAGQGWMQLDWLANRSDTILVALLAQGVMYAEQTGRTTGTVSMALRRCTPWQAAQLLVAMAADGVDLIHQVPAWLNRHALTVLG